MQINGNTSYDRLFKNVEFAQKHIDAHLKNKTENSYQFKEVIVIKSKTGNNNHYHLKDDPNRKYDKTYRDPDESATTGMYQLKPS